MYNNSAISTTKNSGIQNLKMTDKENAISLSVPELTGICAIPLSFDIGPPDDPHNRSPRFIFLLNHRYMLA
jgi:hypothetical protein